MCKSNKNFTNHANFSMFLSQCVLLVNIYRLFYGTYDYTLIVFHVNMLAFASVPVSYLFPLYLFLSC